MRTGRFLKVAPSPADLKFLRLAYAEARGSRAQGETPMGAVIVLGDEVVARAGSREIELADPTAHAEVLAIRQACRQLGTLSLNGGTLYSSVEPCVMCSGAIKWAGLARVVFGVRQSVLQRHSGGRFKPSCDSLVNTGGRHVQVLGPFLEEEGQELLRGFPFGRKAMDFEVRQRSRG